MENFEAIMNHWILPFYYSKQPGSCAIPTGLLHLSHCISPCRSHQNAAALLISQNASPHLLPLAASGGLIKTSSPCLWNSKRENVNRANGMYLNCCVGESLRYQ